MDRQEKADAVDTALRTERDALRNELRNTPDAVATANLLNGMVQNADGDTKARLWDAILRQAAEHGVLNLRSV